MAKCKFKIEDGWECPVDAVSGKDYCYWHERVDGKEPSKGKLERLKKLAIRNVYLREANLEGADLRKANLKGADLGWANLEGADLREANLEGANLGGTRLEGANLWGANLEGAFLREANLKGVNLGWANLERADLRGTKAEGAFLREANLKGANLGEANLEGADFLGARANFETDFTGATLTHSNLFQTYIDNTKTLRNIIFEDKKEINEIVADLAGKKRKKAIIDIKELEKVFPDIYKDLLKQGLVRYVLVEDEVAFLDIKNECFYSLLKKEKCLEVKEKDFQKISSNIDNLLYRVNKRKLYDASYKVYNVLYYFYIQNGETDKALDIHYRRSEAKRKLLKNKGGLSWIRSWLYDWFILKVLTGYGVKVHMPFIISFFIILLFSILFWLTGGIAKYIGNVSYKPDYWDYLYHSAITFTSLGYSNIVPNLEIGHIAQALSAAESTLGIFMIALIIFTITFRMSK